MSMLHPSSDSTTKHVDNQPKDGPLGGDKHHRAVHRYWWLAVLVVLASPPLGFLVAGDRGLLFGLAVGCLTGLKIWLDGKQPPTGPGKNDPAD